MRANRLLGSVVVAALLAAGSLTAAHATGGPPTLSSVTPDPVAADGTLAVVGSGCDASSPVSAYVWKTTGGVTPRYWNNTATGWTATGSGAFTLSLPLDDHFPGGTQIGVTVSCTSTHDDANASASKFAMVALPDPQVDLIAPTTISYGSRPTVTVTTSDASGAVRLQIPGYLDQVDGGSAWGPVHFPLPANLALGTHTLTASFDPAVSGAPTVTDTATVVVTRAGSTTTLTRVGTGPVKAGKKVRLRVFLASSGPRTGTVVIRDGARVRATFTLRAADGGRKALWVKLPKKGLRSLTARYVGNRLTKPSTSAVVKVRVKR